MNSIKEEVTQADREAASGFSNALKMGGLGDGISLAERFAAHRTRSTSDLRAKAEGLAEALRKASDKIDAASTAAVKQDCLPLAEALHNVEIRLRQALTEWDQSQ